MSSSSMPSLRSLRSRVVLSDKSNELNKSFKNSKEVSEVKVLNNYAKGKSFRRNENIPIWNRNLSLSKPKSVKRNMKKIDVYDISLDEEMSCEVVTLKRKVKKCVKTNVKRNNKTKCLPSSVKHPPKLVIDILPVKSNLDKQAVEKTDQKSSRQTECIDNPVETEVQDSFPKTLVDEIVNDIVPEENMDVDVSGVTAESIDDRTFLLHLADELEKSFLIPKMTSTPTKIKVNPQKNNAAKPNILKIPFNTSLKKTVLTQENSPVKDNIDKDITLFESPTKGKKKQKQGKINFKPFIQINLFDEYSKEPNSPPKLDETVIKPNKAYHTPDNFKNHLARTKRIPVMNKRVSKSKEDIIIEKMSQHFEEIGGTELCVE